MNEEIDTLAVQEENPVPEPTGETGNLNNKDSGFLTTKDQQMLDKSIDLRFKIVDNFFKDGDPTDNRDIRVINELLTGVDASIHKRAESRLKYTSVNNTGKLVDIAIATLKAKRSGKVDDLMLLTGTGTIPNITDDIIDVEIVHGELELNPDPLDIEDFVNNAQLPKDLL